MSVSYCGNDALRHLLYGRYVESPLEVLEFTEGLEAHYNRNEKIFAEVTHHFEDIERLLGVSVEALIRRPFPRQIVDEEGNWLFSYFEGGTSVLCLAMGILCRKEYDPEIGMPVVDYCRVHVFDLIYIGNAGQGAESSHVSL